MQSKRQKRIPDKVIDAFVNQGEVHQPLGSVSAAKLLA